MRADRLDIAFVGIAGDKVIPYEMDAIPLYQEISGLYCTPDHPCCGIADGAALKNALGHSEILAHSFVFSPIDLDLALKLLDQNKGVSQDSIELSAYLALSGTHVRHGMNSLRGDPFFMPVTPLPVTACKHRCLGLQSSG